MIQYLFQLVYCSPLVYEIFRPKQYKKTVLLCFILDFVGLFILQSGTISGTNIFGTISGDEAEAYIPWVFIIQLVLRGGQNHQIIQTTFYQTIFTVATRKVGTRRIPTSPLHLGVLDPEKILKNLGKLRDHSHPQFYVALINLTYCHLFHLPRKKNKINHG